MTHVDVNEPLRERPRGPRVLRGLGLVAAYLSAAAAGYAMGGIGGAPATASPLVRVGYALRAENPDATPDDWALLGQDLSAVRAGWKPEERDVLDLVVAVRGLENRGQANYAEAERLCRQLHFSRCDRAALEALRQRARP